MQHYFIVIRSSIRRSFLKDVFWYFAVDKIVIQIMFLLFTNRTQNDVVPLKWMCQSICKYLI